MALLDVEIKHKQTCKKCDKKETTTIQVDDLNNVASDYRDAYICLCKDCFIEFLKIEQLNQYNEQKTTLKRKEKQTYLIEYTL